MTTDECLSCDNPALVDGFCIECYASMVLALTEEDRQLTRDMIAEFFPDEDGIPQYAPADALWMTLYRAGFEIKRRTVAFTRDSTPQDNTDFPIPPVIVPPSPSAAPGVVPVPRNTRQDGDDTETPDGLLVSFLDAAVGDDAYTWENGHGDWGDYVFETVDPVETGAWGLCVQWDADPVLIRKRWRLIEVVETRPPSTQEDDPVSPTETADEGFWRRLATGEDFDPYRIER